MKVLYINQQLGFNLYGGVETQMIETMKHINSLTDDVMVKLFNMWGDKIEEYDIVHIFSPRTFPSESLSIANYAKSHGLKVVVSPIFFDSPIFVKETHNSLYALLWKFYKRLNKEFSEISYLNYINPNRHLEDLFKISDLLLPNTNDELKCLMKTFSQISEEKCNIIPNGVESRFKYGNTDVFMEKYGIDDFILFVGRLEPRKNVIKLIEAFVESELETKLVIIGKKTEAEEYGDLCQMKGNENVIFIPSLLHQSELLRSAYKAAKVVTLPSYLETPGLVALEAGLAGSNLVITEVGGTKEYFGDKAWYIDPRSKDSIREALVSSYATPKSHGLTKIIENNFTWDKIAKKTIEAYYKIYQ
ncbi:glycosyltransferase family 4 protein [Methanobacterium sp.]|uniref:glycosyltransferase family 4 protein n=1 Tax=Methanobacterium sp. TaxID=2164 RepID=UPI0025F1F773|nr:glycosyltransferase family 4 protein [Methanobacterium sp.]MBI5459237.1 glycosyltransferase family 4 protein [Methanobacterium sp.]